MILYQNEYVSKYFEIAIISTEMSVVHILGASKICLAFTLHHPISSATSYVIIFQLVESALVANYYFFHNFY